MPAEPPVKRTVAFFDGQNLFYGAKHAFGYRWPNYDPLLLAGTVCQSRQWHLAQVRFPESLDQSGLCVSRQSHDQQHTRDQSHRLGAHRPGDLRRLPGFQRLPPKDQAMNAAFAQIARIHRLPLVHEVATVRLFTQFIEEFAESRKLEKAIRSRLEGLGYGG